MSVSKNEYAKKIDGIWSSLQKEKGVDVNSLRLERFLLHHLSGTPQDGVSVRMRFIDLDGTPMKSEQELLFALSKGIQRLITKASIGVKKDAELKQLYDSKFAKQRKLLKEKDEVISELQEVVNDLEDRLVDMVDGGTYRSVVSENERLEKRIRKLSGIKSDLENEKRAIQSDFAGIESINLELLNQIQELEGQIQSMQRQLNAEKERADISEHKLQMVLSTPTPAPEPVVVERIVEVKGEPIMVENTADKEMIKMLRGAVDTLTGINKDYENGLLQANTEIQELVKQHDKDVAELQKLRPEVLDLKKRVYVYEKNEKKVMPTLQEVVYRRQAQGKCITLNDSQIDTVIRGHLNGDSNYKISKENHISETTIKQILQCKYKSLGSLKHILRVLHQVNGNWGQEKKDILSNLISMYESAVVSKEQEQSMVKEDIAQRVNSLVSYNREIENRGDGDMILEII